MLVIVVSVPTVIMAIATAKVGAFLCGRSRLG